MEIKDIRRDNVEEVDNDLDLINLIEGLPFDFQPAKRGREKMAFDDLKDASLFYALQRKLCLAHKGTMEEVNSFGASLTNIVKKAKEAGKLEENDSVCRRTAKGNNGESFGVFYLRSKKDAVLKVIGG